MQRPERERKEPTEFNVIVKAKDLVKHTFTITNSTERYPKKYRFTLVNRIQDKAVDIRCVQLRKHSKAREKRYSFGYAVSFIFACYQILWTFPKSQYLCSRYLPLVCG